MGHWVYAFSGCPELDDQQHVGHEAEPGAAIVRKRPGDPGIVDGYVREGLDEVMMVARYRWVASGDPASVTPAVWRAAGAPPLS
ncbi:MULTISPECIES: hypothetical protein [Streptomyces]|uniref:Uncharacterized protein n=2 Tax=Streptomyces violaceusniger group TaxID=2839105 RepID=A0ABD5JIA4_9ACTN|nr:MULTISPECIES: hypothetical protein [Streptomyces]KUL47527.1 hypothetical protein ADL28_32110 [Streptomyces violaceusniger]MEE4588161.1 hypothetical protein [Streptomyces sp. DSM 41602]QTI90452.1 hypothetical protein AS97_59990 [Streptomyces sp. AgN23]